VRRRRGLTGRPPRDVAPGAGHARLDGLATRGPGRQGDRRVHGEGVARTAGVPPRWPGRHDHGKRPGLREHRASLARGQSDGGAERRRYRTGQLDEPRDGCDPGRRPRLAEEVERLARVRRHQGGRGGTGPEAVGVPHHGWSQGGGRRAGHDLRQCGEPAPVVRDLHGVGGGQGVTGGRRPPPGQGHGLASAVDPRERLAPRPQAQLDRRRPVEAQVDHFDAGVRQQAGQPVSVAIGRQGRHQRHTGAGGRGQRRRQGRPAGPHVLDGESTTGAGASRQTRRTSPSQSTSSRESPTRQV
jgi:hypothetical protein